MRQIYLMIFFITLFSCSNEKVKAEKKTESYKTGVFYPEVESRSIIIGQIENMQEFADGSKTIKLVLDEISVNRHLLYLTEIDENGKFKFDIPLRNSINTTIEYCDGSIDLYIFPSDTLTINCKISKVGSLTDINASSYGEKQGGFQKEFQKYDRWLTKEIYKFDGSFSKDKPHDELKEICLDFEKSLHKSIDDKIENGLSNQIVINYLRCSATYYSYYRILTVGKTIENDDEKAEYFSFLTDSLAFNEKAFTTSWYRLFLNYYSHYAEPNLPIKVISNGKTEDQVKKEKVIKRIDNKWGLREGIWRDLLIAANINSSVLEKEEELSANSMDAYFELVSEKITDRYIKQFLATLLNIERLSILERDDLEMPVSELKNTILESGDSLLTELLIKNKGKVIYIDFWGTWCGGCIAEFPHVKKFHDNFDDKDVAFVYFCCRSNQTAYENVIKKYQLEGEHYLLDHKQLEFFQRQFQFSTFPNYAIIDKNGKVYSKDAPRPSDAKTVTLINKLITQK